MQVADGAVEECLVGRYGLASALLERHAGRLPAALDGSASADAMHLALVGLRYRALCAAAPEAEPADEALPGDEPAAAGAQRGGRGRGGAKGRGVFDGFSIQVGAGVKAMQV